MAPGRRRPAEARTEEGIRLTGSIEAIEHAPLGGMQIRAITTIGILSALDGYDVLAMTFAAPGISAAWGIDRAQLGVALSSGLIGMTAGSLALAPLADRFGGRVIALLCLSLMFGGMLMAAFAGDVWELVLWRVVTGVGIGAMVPIVASLAAEYANARSRRLSMAIMSIGYPIGGTVGGFAAALLLRHFEWQSVFLFGALMTGIMLVPTLFWLVEPPASLIARRPRNALRKVNAYLARCGQPPLDELPPPPERRHAMPYRAIFAAGQRADTIRITLINLLFIVTVYYMLSWMPQLVVDLGHDAAFATLMASLACLSGVVACVILGIIGPKIPLRQMAGVQMIGLGVGVLLFGFSGPETIVLIGLAVLVGMFLYSGILGLYSAIVATFDPGVRGTGVGFVMGIGRAAGAISPALAGFLFSIGAERWAVSAALATGSLLAALLILTQPKRYAV